MQAMRRRALGRPPWERSVFDDVVARRPWNIATRASRVLSLVRLRLSPLRPGVTVLIVSWNTLEVLKDVLTAVQRLSPEGTQILVIDNGSGDGSGAWLKNQASVRTVLLRRNAGHGVALDLGVHMSRTTVTVVLDSDALPLSDRWLDPAVEPVRSGRALLAGSRSKRNFVHPMYLAVDTGEFVRRRWSFQIHRAPGVAPSDSEWGVNSWDTGELMTPMVEPSKVVFVERTKNVIDGLPGMTAGGVVYHHGGVSRGAAGAMTDAAVTDWRRVVSELTSALDESG